MLLSELVECAELVGATSSRKEKSELLAATLRKLDRVEVTPAVGFMIGQPRQGKIGVGWSALSSVSVEPAVDSSLTIIGIDSALDHLATIGGDGSQSVRREALVALLGQATASEADYLRRLLIGEMRQGALAGVMADALAKASGIPAKSVRRAAMLAGDLAAIAETALFEDRAALDAVGLEVLRPIQPMLASTSPDVAAALSEVGNASVEWKLDGIRVQIHRDGDEVLVVTRNLNDVTGRLPALVEAIRELPVDSLVVDGEAIGMAGEAPEAFQDTASSFSRTTEGVHHRLDLRLFDLLHLDGSDLIDEPLEARRAALQSIAPHLLMPGELTSDSTRAAEIFDEAIAAGHEGVMVKAADSPYEAGRRGKSWRKVKPVHTFDLVVLAAEWGHGRRQGWLSNLHLGARDPDSGEFLMVGKTFKGLTDELLTWQTQKFQAIKTSEARGVVHVRPEVVVEIALDGVQRSTRYPGGVALRFARVRRYREDKTPSAADTISSLQKMLGA